jgi:FkbM family methyltransferase
LSESEAPVEHHPALPGARLARLLSRCRRLRGWERIVRLLVADDASGAFLVRNPTGYFAGDLSSFIDRRMYLFGEYEDELIRLFVSALPPARRGVVLDIGANVGTHSLAFAQAFAEVHAFEPNPALWPSFETNIRTNRLSNVRLHKVGLGDRDAELPFYLIAKRNFGLGTFVNAEQYDRPLEIAGTARVVHASRYIEAARIGPVDAIKIDVQGFEPEVIRGLRPILERDRPLVWFEVAAATRGKTSTSAAIEALFPLEGELLRFESRVGPFRHSTRLAAAATGDLVTGDYLMSPARQDPRTGTTSGARK